jgi:hypothetical protein
MLGSTPRPSPALTVAERATLDKFTPRTLLRRVADNRSCCWGFFF